MQYKILAAYAAGLIARSDRYAATTESCYGYSALGSIIWHDLRHNAVKLTFLGALEVASRDLNFPRRAYNTLYRLTLRHAYNGIVPRGTKLNTLKHADAYSILIQIAIN